MEFTYLSDIEGDAEDWLIRVRICRLWDAVNTKDNSLLSVDMILVDEKENLIHASIRKHLLTLFRHRVSEGIVCSLKNVKLGVNTSQYRPLASNKKLLFLPTTEVIQLPEGPTCLPVYGFQFVDLPKLQDRADDMSTLLDIVGVLLRLCSVTNTVTLWGKLGEQFDPTLYTGDNAPYVIVLYSSCKALLRCADALTFATTSARKIYVNPEVDHVSSIRERFSALPQKVVTIKGHSSAKLPPKEAMFINQMTVESLVGATCAGELQVKVVTLKATITAINNCFGWYYISCKSCVKRGTLRDGVYICNNCKKPIELPLAM
ncbi:uncharacterized protein LOC141673703 [Apium graveolens]|uniref:uncharacterized protein LOC141673703 n=1 Tax=Apium graveolens TaxID=4045 RepID=UPI003D7BB699